MRKAYDLASLMMAGVMISDIVTNGKGFMAMSRTLQNSVWAIVYYRDWDYHASRFVDL